MTREMRSPTPALDRMVNENIGPERDQLLEALQEMTDGRFSERELHLLGFSIVGQCLFYLQNGPLIDRLCPLLHNQPPALGELVSHIQQFSLAAVRSLGARDDGGRRSAVGGQPSEDGSRKSTVGNQ